MAAKPSAPGAVEHYRDAALYDFEYRRRRADVSFYRTLAHERGGPVLDMACGTGRLTIPLLRDGHSVTGFDRSPSMLVRAQARLDRLPTARRSRGRLVIADLRDFDVGTGFAFAVCAFHSVQHLETDDEIRAWLRAARRALMPGGWLAFDLLPPDPQWLNRDPHRRWARTAFRHPASDQRLVYTTNHRYDPASQLVHVRLYYQPLDPAGHPAGRERIVRLTHRMVTGAQVRTLARQTGFEVIANWGGFDGRPRGADDETIDEDIYLLTPVRRTPSIFNGKFINSRRRAADMAEKVFKAGIKREKDMMYYVKDGGVWKVARKQPGVPKGRPEKVADGGFEMNTDYIYFVDKDGDVSRAERAVGGQKRKKKAGKKAAKRKPAKKKAKAKPRPKKKAAAKKKRRR